MREYWQKDISACGLSGILSATGKRISGEDIIKSIATMHDRGNGLGGGFAAYGIYPEYRDYYAFHLMYYTKQAKQEVEKLLEANFEIVKDEAIPTNPDIRLAQTPMMLWRYFIKPLPKAMAAEKLPTEEDFVIEKIMKINTRPVRDAFVFSSGKNMGAFKAVGYPEDIGRFFRLEEYDGYIWTAHNRFPTNTQSWWGGAHPFTLLDWSVVHNGEISSYGINKRYLEMHGYQCTLFTDTEVVAYLFDLLVRRGKLTLEQTCDVIAAPFWKDVDKMDPEEMKAIEALRMVYSGALLNGPFALIAANSRGFVAINDRVKLRPMVAARKDDMLYVASEESAIIEICAKPDTVWAPKAGEPVIGRLEEGVQ